MENKRKIYIAMSVSAAIIIFVSWTMIGFTQTQTSNLSFKGKANQATYVLGEPISIEFEFTNAGETRQTVVAGGVEVGSLKIFVAGKDGEYKRYVSGSWGRMRGQRITLEPTQSLKYSGITILWNGKPNVSHLNESTAQQVLAGKITTEYAFPEPGIYFVKGVSTYGENATPIESEPIKIVVTEPTGIDLEVWNQIKGNREIALLLQNGAFDTGEEARKEQLSHHVEQIFTQFPNSMYSSYLKRNLGEYKVKEAKRNEAYKNMKLGQKPE